MRLHPLCLLVILPTLLNAATKTECPIRCLCNYLENKFKILHCSSPIYLKRILSGLPKNLSTIGISNVFIKIIEKDAFEGFDMLESIVIQDSTIESIDPSAFDLPELGDLTFTRISFGHIPHLKAQYIEELIFDDCKLTQVPNLDDLPALEFVNLANNLIKDINETAFNKARGLEEVNLANNSITELSPSLFSKNKDFSILNLDNNPLKNFRFNYPSSLERIYLKNCKLTSFDRRSTENLTQINTLDLSNNQISVLSIDVFEPMNVLNNLDLSNNKLVELDDTIFTENTDLDKLILDNNNFETLPKFQLKDSKLTTFSCKKCGLKSVKGAFENMHVGKKIDLSHNNIEDIENVFNHLRELKELSLSNNRIKSIGINTFAENSKLESLDLSNNPLQPLDPVVIGSLQELKKLNVSSCNLKSLWTNQNRVLPKLEKLHIDNNNLIELTVEDLKIVPKLKLLDLYQNPFDCTDDLVNLIAFLKKNNVSPSEESIKTHEELSFDGTSPLDSDYNDWQSVLPAACAPMINDFDDEDEEDEDEEDDENYDNPNDVEYESEEKTGISVEASEMQTTSFSLAKASYVLSITSVFILTALLVLFVAIALALLIFRRNKTFNTHNNLPRLKIPLWHTTLGHKKHSGSVYRPLSEELSLPRTPIVSRYEFKQTPQVHNAFP